MSWHPVPIGDNVIVHPFEDQVRTKIGSLYIPDQAKRRINQGIVISKGPLVSDEIDIADHVIFNAYSGDKISFREGDFFIVVPETHIVAKLEQNKVRLINTETMKRLIQERIGELKTKQQAGYDWGSTLGEIEQSLLDRIDSLITAEGYEW